MPQKPALRPRPSGGFNQGIGQFNDYMDEEAMGDAVQQKAMTQQATSSAQSTTGGSALGAQNPAAGGVNPLAGPGQAGGQAAPPPPPREVGTIQDELITRPAQDIKAGLQSIFDINNLLGINPNHDTPEEKQKKQQMLQRWQKLDAEDQEVAKRIFQKEMQKKQQEEQEKQARKQQEEQRKAQSVVMPSSTAKGAVGPGGQQKKKAPALEKMEQDRKSLGGPQSAG